MNYQSKESIKIVLFDLDNTLVSSDTLKEFRIPDLYKYSENITRLQNYIKKLNPKDLCLIQYGVLENIKQNLQCSLGIITNSPKKYAEVLLKEIYPNLQYDVLIAFEDIGQGKPNPQYIYNAVRKIRRDNKYQYFPNDIIYIGNEEKDIKCAYYAGILAGLYINKISNIKLEELRYPPDYLIDNFTDLTRVIKEPSKYLPLIESSTLNDELITPIFLRIAKYDKNNRRYIIHTSGRYFTYNTIKYNFHKFSQEILENKNLSSPSFPKHWINTLLKFIKFVTGYNLSKRLNIAITCIPHRQNRKERLEFLLIQLKDYLETTPQKGNITLHICPYLFCFDEEALSNHKEAKTNSKRFSNIENHLHINQKQLLNDNLDSIIIIDDIVTTGASLIGASKLLNNIHVILFAFAQAVNSDYKYNG